MIKDNTEKILAELPHNIIVVAAAKKKSISEIEQAIQAGIKVIGENYIKEAEEKFNAIGNKVKWHLIGHLQKNKVKRAVKLFDMVETLDSLDLAEIIDIECRKIDKIMPVLIEVNIAKEPQKSGILPQDIEHFIEKIKIFKSIRVMGLMTMGPFLDNPQDIRPFFKQTREIFQKIKSLYPDDLDWKYLSMGMSDTYKIAIEEGANIVRIGTAIFGPRDED